MNTLLVIGLSNTLVALILAGVAFAAGLVRRRPAVVHALWLLVFVKLLTPPLVRIPLPWQLGAASSGEVSIVEPLPEAVESAVQTPAGEARAEIIDIEEVLLPPLDVAPVPAEPSPTSQTQAATVAVEEGSPAWQSILLGVWLAGSLGWFLLASRRAWRFARILRFAGPTSAEMTARIEQLAGQLGLGYTPRILLVPGRLTPMVWGVFRPLLLIPEQLETQLGREALDTLLIHELAHLRRRDHWVRLLEFVVLGLYWWNPLVWFARGELRESEEQCCDAWVVQSLPGSGRRYASAIVAALDFVAQASCSLPPLASGLGQMADLKRRLKMILRGSTPCGLGRSAGLAVLLLALLLLPFVPALGLGQAKPQNNLFLLAETKSHEDELKKLEEQLRAKKAELDELARKMEDMKRKASGEKPRIGTFNIEIRGVPGKPDELKELVKQVEKMFPGKETRIIIVQSDGRDVLKFAHPGGAGWVPRVVEGLAARVVPPSPAPGVPPTGVPGVRVEVAPRQADKRIDNLEKKVDAILKELDGLRRDLKDVKKDGPSR